MLERIKAANYRTVACIDCNSAPGKKCTTPTDTGRRNIEIVHFAREQAYRQALENRELVKAQLCQCRCIECMNTHHSDCPHYCRR